MRRYATVSIIMCAICVTAFGFALLWPPKRPPFHNVYARHPDEGIRKAWFFDAAAIDTNGDQAFADVLENWIIVIPKDFKVISMIPTDDGAVFIVYGTVDRRVAFSRKAGQNRMCVLESSGREVWSNIPTGMADSLVSSADFQTIDGIGGNPD